jgi:hypothetical protein
MFALFLKPTTQAQFDGIDSFSVANNPRTHDFTCMNSLLVRFMGPVVVGAFLLGIASLAEAQVVTNGIVVDVSAAEGLLTVRADQSQRPVYFRNMQHAKVQRASGTPAKFEDVWPGMRVTVSYAQRGNRWYVGSVAIPDPPRFATDNSVWLMTPGQRHGLYARRSNDITKRPGNTAGSDNDITTKPPRRGLFENDITLRNDNR